MSAGLKSERARAEREGDWKQLERLLAKAESGAGALSDEELLALPVLYRSAMSALASARATSLDLALVQYLESLCSRAYYFVYGVRTRMWRRFARYLAHDLPREVRSLWRETLASAVLTFGPAAAAYFLVMANPDWFYAFVDAGLAGGRDPGASAEFLRQTLYGGGEDDEGLSVFATFLFTHNTQISLWAFALGFVLCMPTAFLLVMNGCMLGAMIAVFAGKGLGMEFLAWLSIHGVTELFAIVLAGAAGLRIGWKTAFPGALARMEAMIQAGRRGGVVMGGVVIMLFAAGLLEGFGRQVVETDSARFAIALATGLFWLGYYYLPRRETGP